MKRLTMLLAMTFASASFVFAANVPAINVCGTVEKDGKGLDGKDRFKRVLTVQGEKMDAYDFYARYCQSAAAKNTETCGRVQTVALLDQSEVKPEPVKGICKK